MRQAAPALEAILRLRARLLAGIRAFFAARGVLEVETPQLYPAAAADPHQHCFAVSDPAGRPAGFLQPSPEYAMKRLLCAGAPSIYQIGKAFRAGERGRLHHPEFTLVEWYRLGYDYCALMDEVEALVCSLLDRPPAQRVAYRDLLQECVGEDPLTASEAALWARVAAAGTEVSAALEAGGRDRALELLMTGVVEPALASRGAVFVHDYPASQAALAALRAEDPALAQRFELYVDGIELANGYTELGDAGEQRRRFSADNLARSAAGLPAVAADEALLGALARGLPACAGVALGFDRLVLLAAGAQRLEAVLPLADAAQNS